MSFFEKMDKKTIIAIFVFIFMGIQLSDKYISKHLITVGQPVKRIILENTKGEATALFNPKVMKHTIVFAFSSECSFCSYQKNMLKFLFNFIDSEQWSFFPLAFDFKTRDHVRSFERNNRFSSPIYFGNDSIKRIFKVQKTPTVYFISSNGFVTYRTAVPTSLVGLLYAAFKTENKETDTTPLLHKL